MEPNPIDLVKELRQALGMFSGAMSISPKEAWDEAIEQVKWLRNQVGSEAKWEAKWNDYVNSDPMEMPWNVDTL